MTATLAIIGYGTLFQTGDNSSPINWTTLAEVKSLALPSLSRDVVDAGHESAPNEWRQILAGLKTAGEISVACNFYKATYQTLLADLDSTAIRARRIVLPDGTYLTFDAYLIGLEAAVAAGDIITAVAKFRPSGAPALTVV
jgi:predicted secreted protein